ncbi:MAG: polysaccharide deacetylase family protein [Dehalococcoidia bacterium]
MTMPQDRFDYSAVVDREPLKLPGDARIVVWTIVNVEEWDIRAAMPRGVLPAPGGASVVPDVPNWAWHEYGMRVGFWRLKAALDNHQIKATMAINASVCLSYPRVAGAARDAGWEFMGHGFTQKALHLEDDQRDTIRKSVETIREFVGKPPRGWLGPGLTETWDTLDLLAQEGIEYVSDWVTDDQPHEIQTAYGSLAMVPYSLEVNDIPIMLVQHHAARELFDRACDQFDRLYQEGENSARIMAMAVHPYVTGVPHRIKYFEKIYEYMKGCPGVLFWTGEQILDWYREQGRE